MGDKPIKLTTESRPFSGDLPQSSNCSICHSSSQPTDPFAEINQSIPPDPSANVSVDTSNGESVSSAPVNSSEPNFNSMFWGGDFYSSFISDRKQSLFQWGVNAGGQISKPMPEVIPDLPDHKKIFDGMKLGYGEARIGESSLNEIMV